MGEFVAHPVGPASAAPMAPAVAVVVATRRESHDTVTLTLSGRDAALIPPAPGQFNMLYAFGVGEVPISVSGLGPEGRVDHTIRSVGGVTRALCALSEGAEVGVRGPFGVGWDLAAAFGRDVVVMAGGIGLAPLRPVIEGFRRRRGDGGSLRVLVGARSPGELVFRSDLQEWSADPSMTCGVTVDRVGSGELWDGHVGVVTELVGELALTPERTVAYLCGPEVMMRFGAQRLLRAGLAPAAVQLSAERNMACAVGHCGHCQWGGLLICRDGPVLGYPVIEPLLGVREW